MQMEYAIEIFGSHSSFVKFIKLIYDLIFNVMKHVEYIVY